MMGIKDHHQNEAVKLFKENLNPTDHEKVLL